MRTNFAYIDTAASNALVREMETSNLPATVRERASKSGLAVIAGFVVSDENAVNKVFENALRERRSAVDTYHTHRDQVAAKLDKLDIKPLAILPKTAWECMCAASGLYRLNPNESGQVLVNGESKLKAFEYRAVWLSGFAWVGLLATLMSVAAFIGYQLPPPEGASHMVGAIFLALMTGIVSGLLGGVLIMGILCGKRPYIWGHSVMTRLLMGLYRFKPHALLLRDYFPGGISPTSSNMLATLVLPTPPQDVSHTLFRAKSLKLKVAAVGEAIAFVETPGQVLGREHQRRVELRLLEAERLKLDPIIYHEHGSAVAIIAQFGDFPIEQRVVDEVVNSEHLL